MNYTNESTLVLFNNDKGNNPKRPDMRGKVYLNGEEYKVSVWKSFKKDGTGEEYLRGRLERATAAPQTAPQAPKPPVHIQTAIDQDAPF